MTPRLDAPAPRARTRVAARALVLAGTAFVCCGPARIQAQLCDGQTYVITSCVPCPDPNIPWPRSGCIKAETFSCVTGQPRGLSYPNYCKPESYVSQSTEGECRHRGATETCGDHLDNDFDGCADGGCILGSGACACAASCATPSCVTPPQATCDPRTREVEVCNGVDDNCDGEVDEGCAPPGPGPGPGPIPSPSPTRGPRPAPSPNRSCKDQGAKAGADPILLANQSAVTEPFTDFSVETLQRLSLTRTYSSKDGSLFGGPMGVFGRGWHHDWEGELWCSGGICTVSRGLGPAMRFSGATTASSLDGSEVWTVYRPHAVTGVFSAPHRGLLVERPDGEWIVFQVDGSELHFRSICDACAGAEGTDRYCAPVSAGGRARLVSVVDAAGWTTRVTYDRPNGTVLQLSDDLGHVLRLASSDACGAPLATSLSFDGRQVATYSYTGADLVDARDGDGRRLRGYAYEAQPGGLLLAVLDEAGAPIAEFSYDVAGRAIGVVDRSSSVSVEYRSGAPVLVTEHFGADASATSQRTLDLNGRVVSISDQCACGPATRFTYQDRQLACITDATGNQTHVQYDQAGRVIRTASYSGASCPPPVSGLPSGAQVEWRDYALVKPIAAGVALDLDLPVSISRNSTLSSTGYAAESFDYDPSPNTSIDPAGYRCTTAPLPVGAVVCRHIRSGYVTAANGAKVLERIATFYSYDQHGRVVRTVGPLSLDRPSASDVMPLEERAYWDDAESLARRGRLRELRRYPAPGSAPLVTSFDYDAFGVSRTVAPDGGITLVAHDARGRPSVVTAPDGGRWETRYQDGSSPRLTLSPTGAVRRYVYDVRGRISRVELLAGDPEVLGASPAVIWSEHRTYDAAGNRVHAEYRDETGTVTWTNDRVFDVQHRIVSESHPEYPSLAKTTMFDPTGVLSTMTDEEGRVTAFGYDGLRRVVSVRRSGVTPLGAPVSLEVARYVYQQYSATLASATDGKAIPQRTSYRFDDFGRLETLSTFTIPNTTPTFSTDPRGNVRQRKLGQTTVDYTYDGLDRVTTVTARNTSDGSSIAYTFRYDEGGRAGRLTSVVEPERTIRFGYDAAGRMTSESIEETGVTAPLVTTHRYDLDGDLTGITLPSGRVLAYALDPATKQPTRVFDETTNQSYASAVRAYPFGPLRSLTFGNGQTLAHGVDRRYQPTSIASGPVLLGYQLSPAGNLVSLTDGTTSRTFAYDFLDRLVESPGWFRYAYDGAGNRTSQTVDGARATYTLSFDRLNDQRVPYGTGDARSLVFGYDLQSNVASIASYVPPSVNAQRAICLRHDALGRLVSAGAASPAYAGSSCPSDSSFTVLVARYKYDFRGRRVARWDPAATQWTYFVTGPQGQPIEELVRPANAAGTWVVKRGYAWLGWTPVAQLEHAAGAARAYAVHADHLGMPRALTSPGGAVVWSATASPYGEVLETTTVDPEAGGTVVTNLRLPGQYDERLFAAAGISGMQGPYYNSHRWYLPWVGRYLELDPIAMMGGFNAKYGVDWYSYGNGNPLKYTDRTGNSAILIAVGAGLAIGTVWLFMHCMEKCTGVKVERPPTCETAPDNNKIAKCANYCANVATLLGCIGVGEAAQCAITTVEQEASGGGN